MRTPIHVRTTARASAPSARRVGSDPGGYTSRELVLGDLIITAGPKNETGRLVRVYLTERQAQELAADLAALLAE
jgi:hypothetical protein